VVVIRLEKDAIFLFRNSASRFLRSGYMRAFVIYIDREREREKGREKAVVERRGTGAVGLFGFLYVHRVAILYQLQLNYLRDLPPLEQE